MSDSQENAENCKLRAFEKNNYFYGKLMTVRDFVLEQQYVNDKRWLINNLLFGSGTVCGLNVSSDGTNIFIESGFAIDRCGREIILPENVSLTLAAKDTPEPGYKKAIYISYKECPKERVRAQTASTCDEVCANNRTEESYDFEIRDVQADRSDPTNEELCGIWSNHVTEDIEFNYGNDKLRFKRITKKYVSEGDLFEVYLELTNLNNSNYSSIPVIIDTLPTGLSLVDGNNIIDGTIPFGETIKKWYVVRVNANPPGKFVLRAKINNTPIKGESLESTIEVKSPGEISKILFEKLIKLRTEPCFEGDIDSGVKIAEFSLENQKIIVDNTKRKFVNNNKNMTKMLECLRVQASALEDQSVGIKNKIAPSNVLISASPTEIDADGEQVSSITINVRNDAGVGLSDIDVNLISTLGNIINRVRTGPDGSAAAILTSGTISGSAAVLATTGIGTAVTQVAFKSTTGSIEGYVKEKTDETTEETNFIIGAVVSVGTITTVTDSEGHYSLTNVPHGNQIVWAFASGYDKASSLVDVKANQVNRIDISLDPISISGTIKGKVTDIEGNVIENTVHVTAEGITASTDETGNYTLSNVPAGTHTVTASSDGYQTQNRASVVVTDDGITLGIDFMLEKATGTIKGRVTIFPKLIPLDLREGTIDERIPVMATPVRILPIPTGIEGATVSVLGTSKSVLTDSSGNYEIRNVPLGTQTVIASAPNYNASTSSVLVEANVAITLNFQLKPLVTTGTVTGRVTTLRKRIVPICTSSVPALTIDPGLTRTIDSTIVRPLDTTVVRPLDTATIRPVDTPFVRPIPCNAGNPDYRCFAGGPSNLMEEIGIPGATVSVAGLSTVTDSLGNYSIRNVPEGSQVVSANAAGYVAQSTTATVPAGGTTTANFQLVIAVSRGTISGRVTKFSPVPLILCRAGIPGTVPLEVGIKGAVVSVAGKALSAITDDSGNYTISDVPTGTYTVNASASGYNAGTQGATVNENQISTVNFQLVLLPTTGEISGRVTNTSGSPIVSAIVKLVEVNNSVNTDASGNYRFPNVRPGSHTVSVSASGYNSSSRTVNVIAGQVTAADFVLSKEILCVAGRPDSEIICTGARPREVICVAGRPDSEIICTGARPREVICVAGGPTALPIPETRCVSAIPRDIELPCTGATPRIFVPDRPVVEPPIDRPVIGTPGIDRPVIGTPGIDRPVIGTPGIDRPVIGMPGIDRPVIGAPTVVRPISKRTGAGTACPAGRPTIAPEEKTQPQVKAKKGRKK